MTPKNLLAVVCTLACTAAAAQSYPNKPITLLVGFPPGGGADSVARVVSERLGKELGQPIIVENKPGAGTTIASDLASRAAPDGYTLLLARSASTALTSCCTKVCVTTRIRALLQLPDGHIRPC